MVSQVVAKVLLGHCYGVPGGCQSKVRRKTEDGEMQSKIQTLKQKSRRQYGIPGDCENLSVEI